MLEGCLRCNVFFPKIFLSCREPSFEVAFHADEGDDKANTMIDLHTHSKISDGQYSPAELVRKASMEGIETLALTDHDTIGGIAEALRAAQELKFELIPGVELDTFVGTREIHLLGHFIDPYDEKLTRFVQDLREARIVRVQKMIEKLNDLGLALTFEEVACFSEGDSIGRTHLAQALSFKGYTDGFQDAFSRYIGTGKPGFVGPMKIPSEEAIAFVHGAGGTATLAHGLAYGVTHEELALLKSQGLDGVEIDHPDHDFLMRQTLAKWALEFELVPTAGSDFHGERILPERRLCECSTSKESLEALRARRRVPVQDVLRANEEEAKASGAAVS